MNFILYLYQCIVALSVLIIPLIRPKSVVTGWLTSRKVNPPKIPITGKQDYVLIHCSSVGEYLSIRSLVDHLTEYHSDIQLVISIFSTDALGIIKSYHTHSSHLILSPIDQKKQLALFFHETKPLFTIIAGLELWPVFIQYHLTHDIPLYLANVTFNVNDQKKRIYVVVFSHLLRQVTGIFTCYQSEYQYFKQHGFKNVINSGDLRIEQLITAPSPVNSVNESIFDIIDSNKEKILLGSFDTTDLPVLAAIVKTFSQSQILVVPHDLTWYELEGADLLKDIIDHVVVVPRYGVLKHLYAHVDLIYIGGGFGKGVHNVVEAIRFIKPCIIGPNHKNFTINRMLVEAGVVWALKTPDKIIDTILLARETNIAALQSSINLILQDHLGSKLVLIDQLASHLMVKNNFE